MEQQRKANVPPSQVHGQVVCVAQVKLQLLERQAAAGHEVKNVTAVLVYQNSAVVSVHRYFGEDASRPSRPQDPEVGERRAVQVDW